MEYVKEKIENLPDNPGVYLFKDEKGTILYVGKAGNIKHRVSLLFPETGWQGCKDPVPAREGGRH